MSVTIGVADEHGARRQVIEPGDAVHQRRLAGTGGAHDRGEATGGEVDGDAVEGSDLVLASAVHLDGVEDTGGRGTFGTRRRRQDGIRRDLVGATYGTVLVYSVVVAVVLFMRWNSWLGRRW